MRTLTALLAFPLLALSAAAQLPAPRLLKDIAPGSDDGSRPGQFTRVGPWTYFTATGDSGSEIYRTGGTIGSTALFLDLAPGAADSYPASLTAVGDRLFFFANDGSHGVQLHVSDGTTAGTTRVTAIADLSPLCRVLGSTGNRALAAIFDANRTVTLWSSDGTTAGTVDLSSAHPGLPTDDLRVLASDQQAPDGRRIAYITGRDANYFEELWITDGTAAGTRRIGSIPTATAGRRADPGISIAPGRFAFFVDQLGVVVADVATHALALVIPSNAIRAGRPALFDGRAVFPLTRGPNEIAVATDGSSVTSIAWPGVPLDGAAILGEAAGSLWIYGRALPDFPLARLDPGTATAVPVAVHDRAIDGRDTAVRFGSRFYFDQAGTLREVDVSTATSRLAFDRATFGPPRAHFGVLLFSGNDVNFGYEPHALEPVSGRVTMLGNLQTSGTPGDSRAANYTRFGERVVFQAATPPSRPVPWITDGTTAGTVPLPAPGGAWDADTFAFFAVGRDCWIVPDAIPQTVARTTGTGPTQSIATLTATGGTPIQAACAFGHDLLFGGQVGNDAGLFLLRGDGTTTRLAGVPDRMRLWKLVPNGDFAFALGIGHDDSITVWLTLGTPAGTLRVGAAGTTPYRAPVEELPSTALFADRLWIGAQEDTFVVDARGVRPFSSAAPWPAAEFAIAGNRLFAVQAPNTIHVTDGTLAGTSTQSFTGGTIRRLTIGAVGSRVLFVADSKPWASDGTAAGTERLVDGFTFPWFDFTRFEPLGPDLVIFSDLGNPGSRYVTDGTRTGTVSLGPPTTQIDVPGQRSSLVSGGRYHFTARFDPAGREPFVIDLGAAVETVGAPCNDDPFRTVTLDLDRRPRLGTTVTFTGHATGATAAAMVFGPPAFVPEPLAGSRCALQVTPFGADVFGPVPVDASGTFRVSLPIPNVPALTGIGRSQVMGKKKANRRPTT